MIDRTETMPNPKVPRAALLPALLGAGLLFVYWPTMQALVDRWLHDPRYSHGLLVPLFAGYLLWYRWTRPAPVELKPSWWGLPILATGIGLRLAGTYIYFEWLEAASLLPCLAGLCVLLGGWPALRRAWEAIAFLIFMIPLPYRLEISLGHPLQRIGTIVGTYGLQTLGLPASSEGNIIQVGEARIGVVDACNGLGMIYTFLAITTGVALLVRRPPLDKVLIVLSAIPIALAANVARITVTGLLHVTAGDRIAQAVYHDLAGWLMMPAALGAIWFEILLLSRLLIEDRPAKPIPVAVILAEPRASTSRDPAARGRRGEGSPSIATDSRPEKP